MEFGGACTSNTIPSVLYKNSVDKKEYSLEAFGHGEIPLQIQHLGPALENDFC